MNYYRQCKLQRHDTFAVAWIPEHLAKEKQVIVVNKTGECWEVIEAYKMRITEQYLKTHERDHLTQRQASDI